jgi:hypothetical protein
VCERAKGSTRPGHDHPSRRADQRALHPESQARGSRTLGFDARKARSLTDRVDSASAMADALETAAARDREFARTGRLVGPLHGVVMAIKDQYDTKDMRARG